MVVKTLYIYIYIYIYTYLYLRDNKGCKFHEFGNE
jgi:hypothetical protein